VVLFYFCHTIECSRAALITLPIVKTMVHCTSGVWKQDTDIVVIKIPLLVGLFNSTYLLLFLNAVMGGISITNELESVDVLDFRVFEF